MIGQGQQKCEFVRFDEQTFIEQASEAERKCNFLRW